MSFWIREMAPWPDKPIFPSRHYIGRWAAIYCVVALGAVVWVLAIVGLLHLVGRL